MDIIAMTLDADAGMAEPATLLYVASMPKGIVSISEGCRQFEETMRVLAEKLCKEVEDLVTAPAIAAYEEMLAEEPQSECGPFTGVSG